MSTNITPNSSNNVTVLTNTVSVSTTTDNSKVVTIVTPGPQGPSGSQGPQGPPGSGAAATGSLVSTASFSNPNIQFTKGDGSTFNVDLTSLSEWYDGGTFITSSKDVIITGSLTVSGSNTFTNIGPAVFEGNISASGNVSASILNIDNTTNPNNDNILKLSESVFRVENHNTAVGGDTPYVQFNGDGGSDRVDLKIYGPQPRLELDISGSGFGNQFKFMRDGATKAFQQLDTNDLVQNVGSYNFLNSGGITTNVYLNGGGVFVINMPATASKEISSSAAISASFFVGDGSKLTNLPLIQTASVSNDTITFTKGDGTTFPITIDNVSHSLEANDLVITVKNTSGGTLNIGTAVHAVGVTGENLNVVTASADDPNAMPAVAVLSQTIANNANGTAIISGRLVGLNTTNLVAGSPVYVNNAGLLTATKPTGSSLIQNIGVCAKVNGSDGEIIVQGAGRTNAVPNLLDNQIFFGSGSDQSQQIHISGALDSTVINNITASGDISASGNISAISMSGDGSGLTGINATLPAGVVSSSLQFTNTDDVTFRNITGSGDISASGELFGNQLTITKNIPKLVLQTNTSNIYSQIDGTSGNVRIDVDNGNQVANSTFGVRLDTAGSNQLSLNSSGDLTLAGHITASGNISASGNIIAVSMSGDGSGLTGITATLPSGVISSSLQFTSTDDVTFRNITSSADISASGTIHGELMQLINTTTGDSLLIETTEDSSTAAPVISLKRNSASPADGDYLGQIKFLGENDNDQSVVYAKITGKIADASDTTEDGLIEFAVKKGGSNGIVARLTNSDLKLINSTGLEVAGNISTDGTISGDGSDLTNLQRPISASVQTNLTASNTNSGFFFEVGGLVTCSIQTVASVTCDVGNEYEFFQTGSGNFLFETASGVTMYSKNGLKLNGEFAACTLKHIKTNTWVLIGDMTT